MKIPIAAAFFSAIFFVAAVMTLVAFLPTYQAGLDGVESTINTLRTATVGKMAAEVGAFFAKPIEVFRVVALSEKIGSPRFGGLPFATRARYACNWQRSLTGIAEQFEFHAYDHPTEYRTACSPQFTGLIGSDGSVSIYMFNYTLDMAIGPLPFPAPTLPPPSVYKSISQALLLPELYVPAWGAPEPGLSKTRFWLGMKTLDEFGNFSEMSMQISPGEVTNLLINVGLRPRARAFVAHKATYRMVGTSWNETTYTPLAGFGNISVPPPQRMIVKNVSDLGDALVQETVKALGGEDALFALPAPYQTTFEGDEGKVFVDIVDIIDQNGLGLRVLLTMPMKDFTEEIDETRGVTIGIVCGVLVFMLVVSIVFAMLLAKPLQSLGHRMYLTASLQDSGDDDSQSLIAEIADMQAAYSAMKAELNRMKSFLPQSLLENDDDEDEVEDEGSLQATSSRGHSTDVGTKRSSDRSSMRSAGSRSSRRETVTSGGVVVVGLNTKSMVTSKRVAVMAINLVGFHKKCDLLGSNTGEGPKLQRAYLTMVQKHIRANKGVVDVFQGDHVIASFNAVTNVVAYGKRTINAAYDICREAREDPSMPKVAVGVSSSVAVVGNMGTADMQRFNIMGPVYSRATSLVRQATQRLRSEKPVPSHPTYMILTHGNVVSEIELEYLYQYIRMTDFDEDAKTAKKQAVASIEGPKSMATDEWMYQLKEGEDGDPFAKLNEAYKELANGHVEKAKELATSLSPELEGTAALREELEMA